MNGKGSNISASLKGCRDLCDLCWFYAFLMKYIRMKYEINIDICICTFRRAHVAKTICSIANLELPAGCKLHIIIADNDEIDSARHIVQQTAQETGMDMTYLYAPAFNIPVARNACLDAATAPLLAFIDDDELVTPGWLKAMLSTMERTHADVVLGPVHAVYNDTCPDWIRKGNFHSTSPVFTEEKIKTVYSGNVLMRRLAPAIKDLRFRKELGRAGGEDTAFFSAVYKRGAVIAYAPEAVITEAVTCERASLLWLLRRYFRFGLTHGVLLTEDVGEKATGRVINSCKALAKAAFCSLMLPLHVFEPERLTYWLLRGTLHTGVLSAVAFKPRI